MKLVLYIESVNSRSDELKALLNGNQLSVQIRNTEYCMAEINAVNALPLPSLSWDVTHHRFARCFTLRHEEYLIITN